MDLLIVWKWLTNWEGREGIAPSIITVMINLGIKGGEVEGTHILYSNEFQ